MADHDWGLLRKLVDAVASLAPAGPDEDGPPPDVDGRRDTDVDYDRAVLKAVSQMQPPRDGSSTRYGSPKDDPSTRGGPA